MDCSALDNDFLINLSGDEFKVWMLFLLRCKSLGERGSVPITTYESLSRNWNVPVAAIQSLMEKAGDRISEKSGRWYVKNWNKYQEDFRDKKNKTVSPEISGDTSEPTTVQHPTGSITATPPSERENQKIPTLEDVISFFKEKNYVNPKEEGSKFYNYYAGIGWMIKGSEIKNWKRFADTWNNKSLQWLETLKGDKNGKSSRKYENTNVK